MPDTSVSVNTNDNHRKVGIIAVAVFRHHDAVFIELFIVRNHLLFIIGVQSNIFSAKILHRHLLYRSAYDFLS